jgi:parallel beta-helix repeat protein
MGLYGNTGQASRSPTNASFTVLTLNDGGSVRGAATLYWVASAAATGHTVRIQYSTDKGTNWVDVATNVSASAGQTVWDTTLVGTYPRALWRVMSEVNPFAFDVTDSEFTINNGPLSYYVNDSSTNGNVYTTAASSPSFDGLAPDTPLPSLFDVLNLYVLRAGDTVYVDTGSYTQNTDAVVSQVVAENTNRLTIVGSTNYAAGGTVIYRGGSGNGLLLQRSQFVDVRHLAFDGGSTGVSLTESTNCVFQFVSARNAATGFSVADSGEIRFEHCVAGGHSSRGLYGLRSLNTVWQSGVLWSNGYGAYAEGGTQGALSISNSVIGAFGDGRYAYYWLSGRLYADYNDLFLTNGARAAQVATGQVAYAQVTVSRWARDAGQDRRSLTHEPRFANAAAGDFHPKSQAGRFDPSSGLVVTDAVTSVLVDAGPAGWAFASEPAPNGSRINLGAFANTAEASRTPTNASFTVISLNDGGRIEGTNYLYWIARGDATGHTARLEFSPDGGATWTNITTNASASADAYLWNTLPYASTIRGVWRIVSAKDAGVTDQSDSWFALRNTPLSFYVNDAGTNGDVYATGPGAPGNLGATADQPALSIQTVLDAWDLEPGDVVYVDTGSYAPASVVTVGSFDQGGGTNRVTIQGSTNDAAGGTVLWTNGVKASGAESVAFRNLRIRNASVGVSLLNSMTGLVEWCEAADCGTGFEINASDGAVLLHNVARGGTKGVDHEGGSRAVVWRNGVVWSNDMGVYFAGGPSAFLQVENSVIGVRAANDYGFYYLQSGTLTSDYNNVLVAQHANAGFKQIGTTITVYQNLARWVRDFGQDAHSLSHDALFVDPDGGDFHLRSQGGRNIGPGVFTNDAVTSPLIDAGHPLSDFAAETLPNGARVNIGRYGASGQASRTPTNGALTAVSLNDGGRVEGMFPLQWVARGAATGHQVRIEYSGDAGGTWTVIASNVAASAGQVTWDSTAYASSILGVWRIGSQTDSSVTDTSDVFFAVRNLPLSFYVNDASTNGDVYTTSAGVGSNYGAAPATPKASVQDVLDRWDLEPGDTIYVDTGAYFPTGAVSVGSFDAGGTTTNRVTIQGSTNLLAGGTVLWSNGVSVVSANGVGVRHLTMRSASAGVRFSTAQDCLVEWTTALGGQTGFEVSSSRNTLLRHCAARSCSLGVYNSSGTATDTTTWESGILWSNNWGVQMSGGTMLFSNSIVGVFGSGRYGYQLSGNPPTLRADYNDFFLQNDGYPAYKQLSGQVTPTIYQTVSRWARDYGEDRHTLSHDPRFADSVAGDFHLRSRGGRFAPTNGTFMADADTSPLIDAGAPVAEYAAESSPNGARLNIGLYGNTPEASRSPSNETDSVLTAITASDGGRLEGLVALFWAASGPVTGHTARLDYSADGGQSWSVIATGLQVSAGAYEWNSTLHTSSMLGRWKITSTSNTNLTDATDNVFALRNTPLSFYVNDLGSAGDVYCTALGSSTNLGVAPSGPQASVQAVLALWDLEPGDTVYVDTGAYTLSDPITVGSFDAGTATNRVTLQGSTNDAAGGSILTKFGGGDGIYIDTADGIAVRNLTIRNAGNGLHTYRANYGLAEWVKCEDGSRGFYLDTTTDFELRHCAALDNTEAGIRNRQSSSTTWESGVLWNNRSGTYADGGALRVGNTAIGAVSAGSSAHFISSGSISSEYNAIYLQSGGVAASVLSGGVGSGTQRYAAVYSWAAYSGQDRKSLTANPLFADASGGDFHLRSTAGRYSNGVDVVDAETSPLMDAGNPASDYSAERDPDGGRINIGLYGNSAQSSLTPTNPGLTIVSLDGGGTVTGIVALCWIARGSVTSQTVALDVSSDGGLTWSNVSVGLPATADCVDWNSATMPNSVQGLWRVYTEGPPLVSATSAVTFILRNGGGISYYVNDGSTLSDVYATAAGSATNTGDRPSAPKASIQAVLDAYDLEPGDRIFVDTGTYNLSANVVIGELDAGTVSNRVVIQGSTNAAAGGSVLDRQAPESSVAVQIYESGGIHVRDLTVKGAAEGLQVYKSPGCLVERVRAEDNANYGLSIQQTSVDFSRCVARNNGACGLSVFGQATWHHGVIWSAGDAVRFANGSAVFSNSIFRAAGSASRVFRLGLGGSVQGDYNAFIRSEGAYIAQKDNASGGNDYYPSLSAWAKGYGQDQHSFATDLTAFPEENFADVLNGDFHLRSVVGRHLPGSGLVTDTIHSVLIDIGSPGSGYTNEPAPNGGRLNIGAYGATAEASLSRTNPWLNAVSVNDGGLLLGTNILYWQSGGLATDDAVRIEYSPNNGVEWYILVTNLPVTSESYPWDVVGLTPTVLGRWRVINEENENLIDTNDTAFSIRNEPQVYYVNDTSQVYDVYCTAPGHPTNTGKSASAPMDSPASLLARYPIGFGDTIYLDTGYYLVSNNLVLNELNRGESGFPIRVIGSTNAAGTVIDRGSTNAAEQAYGFRITNTRYVSLEHLRFTGAGVGVGVDGSIRCSLNGVQAYSNLGAGVSCGFVDLRADHCASWANGGAGLVAGFAGAVIWEHGVIWSNGGNAFEASLGTVWMSNSVAHASGSGGTGVVYVFTRNLGTILSDYNLFLRGAGAGLGRDLFYQATFNTLLDWQSASGGDRHTLLADPLFADASRGDFHVRSRQGRWVPGTGYVTTDTVTSWAIDAGAPASAYTNEPAPNGSRANIGLYGNSAEASLSDTNRGLLAVNLNDGGSVKGVVKLYWVSRGFGTADTVRLRFSTDNGLSWTNIATNISVTADGFDWNPQGYPSTPVGRWEVQSESDPGVSDASDQAFFLRVGPFSFFVNDASTANDVFCDDIGRTTNLGTSAFTPKSTIQEILDSYDIDGGDTIFVDTGHYALTNSDTFGLLDSGIATSFVRVVGSTNIWGQGTILDRFTTNALKSPGLIFNYAQYVKVQDVVIQNASIGLSYNGALRCVASNVLVRDSGKGASMSLSTSNLFERCAFSRVNGGVASSLGTGHKLDRCVIWSNTADAIVVQGGTFEVIHSAVEVVATNYCYAMSFGGSLMADYNDLFLRDRAAIALQESLPLERMPQWIARTTQDVHSLSMDPLWGGPTNDDFHPMSASGRTDPLLGVVFDAETSYLIDTGDPAASWTNEPVPNGGRRNIGLYGGTPEASRSRTNAWLLAITAMAGGRAEGVFYLVWAAGALDSTNRVQLDYSYDNGSSWTPIANDLAVYDGQYLWNSAEQVSNVFVFAPSPIARWRVVLQSNTNVQDVTDQYFALRNVPFTYYVNDASLTNDLYTSAPGDDANLGIFSYAPKATLRSLLDVLDVEGGDTIYLDTGLYAYPNSNLVVLGKADEGRVGQPVVIQGSTAVGGTILDRASYGANDHVFSLQGDYFTVRDLRLKGGNVSGQSSGLVLERLSVTNGYVVVTGIGVTMSDLGVDGGRVSVSATNASLARLRIRNDGLYLQGANLAVQNLLAYGGTGSGVRVHGANAAVIRNATLAPGTHPYWQTGSADATLKDSILVADGPNDLCLNVDGGTLVSDYNNLVARGGASIGARNGIWEALLYWQRESGQDPHSLALEPYFADEAGGDYHLKSAGGRWTGSGYTNDTVTSPCIDTGDPLGAYATEPDPDGGRVNLGAYGNTLDASLSRTGAWLRVMTVNDGGVLRGTNTLRWTGGNLPGGALLSLQYSTDHGSSWINIATNVDALAGEYAWNTSTITNSLFTLWRAVVQSAPGVNSQTENEFPIRNAPYKFYVNDPATANDVYCTGAGSPANSALTEALPMESVEHVLSTYDTEGQDTVYVDTGTYAVPSDIFLRWSRGGDSNLGAVVIQGSTNLAAGGSVFLRGNTNAGSDTFEIRGSYVTLRSLTLRGANQAVALESMRSAGLERLLVQSNAMGIHISTCDVVWVRNNRFAQNAAGGLRMRSSQRVTVENNTFYGNRPYAVEVLSSLNVTLQNNIVSMTTNSTTAYNGEITQPFMDYNVYHFAAPATYIYGAYNDLRLWQLASMHDYRSEITNPLYADEAAGDFHPQSTQGRFQDGTGWVTDSADSWAIDKGNPFSDYGLEPTNNGGRVNIGYDGNTEFASRGAGPTGVVVFARTGNGALVINSSPWPLIWSVLRVPSNLLFSVQYSGDGGVVWSNITTGVSAYQEYILWNLSPFYNSYKGRWRVVGEGVGNTNYWDLNDADMEIFFGEFDISSITRPEGLGAIVWRGAWDETYQVQYASNYDRVARSYVWTNAVDGPATNQKAFFLSTRGGDFEYQDVESTNKGWRAYRVLWQQE